MKKGVYCVTEIVANCDKSGITEASDIITNHRIAPRVKIIPPPRKTTFE